MHAVCQTRSTQTQVTACRQLSGPTFVGRAGDLAGSGGEQVAAADLGPCGICKEWVHAGKWLNLQPIEEHCSGQAGAWCTATLQPWELSAWVCNAVGGTHR